MINSSVALTLVFKTASSTVLRSSIGKSSYSANCPAFTIAMSSPALIAWYRNTECIASRTMLLPRKEKDTLLNPPETSAPGKLFLIHSVVSIKSIAYLLCSSMPVAIGKRLGSRIMSCGLKPTSLTNISYEVLHISLRRSNVSACPCSSNAMTTTAAP